ncbi:MAG TPA: DUF3488 domain-containing protein, partial [Rubrivivax sp.]|nr:DUF3488 domain-containing protein [Rubrivivax sp.]
QQFDLLRNLGFAAPSWEDLVKLLTLLLGGAALAGAGWAWWDRRRQDPWLRLQQRVQLRLAALGVDVGPQHAPRERALRVRQQLGKRGEAAAAQLEALDQQRYGSGGWTTSAGARWWRGFVHALRAR